MTDAIINPHDRFFKATFSRRETALSFLQTYLPPELAQTFDFSSFEISKDSFVDSELKEHFSDILYKTGLQSGGQACIYILFEHKSYQDKLAAFQILKYMVKIWEQQRRQNEEQKLKQKYPLKPIFPLLVYHGKEDWKVGLNFVAIFDQADLPDVLRPYVPDYEYWLYDLSQYSDEEIKGEVISRLGTLLLKYIYRDDLLEALRRILPLLIEVQQKETGLEYIETVLRYLTSGAEKITEAELTEILKEVYAEGEKLMPTIAQQWIEQGWTKGRQEGRQEGLKEGLEKGLEKGERKARVESLNQIVTLRFSVELGKFEKQVARLTLKTLKKLTEIALTVESLADFEKALTEMRFKNQ